MDSKEEPTRDCDKWVKEDNRIAVAKKTLLKIIGLEIDTLNVLLFVSKKK